MRQRELSTDQYLTTARHLLNSCNNDAKREGRGKNPRPSRCMNGAFEIVPWLWLKRLLRRHVEVCLVHNPSVLRNDDHAPSRAFVVVDRDRYGHSRLRTERIKRHR